MIEMSDNGQSNSGGKNKNAGKEEIQSKDPENKSNEDDSLSHEKCKATAGSICKPPDSTAVVAATSVPFWKDPKIWIQIAIVGVQMYVSNLTSSVRFILYYNTDSFF